MEAYQQHPLSEANGIPVADEDRLISINIENKASKHCRSHLQTTSYSIDLPCMPMLHTEWNYPNFPRTIIGPLVSSFHDTAVRCSTSAYSTTIDTTVLSSS